MKEIVLTQRKVALCDDKDFEYLNQFKWYAEKNGKTFYAKRALGSVNGKQRHIKMHHEVLGCPPKSFEADHQNGWGLDNQRHNLRFVTHRQNQQNRKHQNKSSQYPGVCWKEKNKKWQAQIKINGIRKYLGLFVNELEAFEAYKQAVESLGEIVIGSH